MEIKSVIFVCKTNLACSLLLGLLFYYDKWFGIAGVHRPTNVVNLNELTQVFRVLTFLVLYKVIAASVRWQIDNNVLIRVINLYNILYSLVRLHHQLLLALMILTLSESL